MENIKKPPIQQPEKIKALSPFPFEKIRVFTRAHWLIPAQSVTYTISFFVLLTSLAGITSYYLSSPLSFIVAALLLLSSALVIAVKIIADWYFHFYIITTRRISEVSYMPMSTYTVNEVMLDRVKCTEVDIVTEGFFRQIFDIGSVVATFDRPTHKEAFVFANIAHAGDIGALLTGQHEEDKQAVVVSQQTDQTVWHKQDSGRGYYTTEEIFPGVQLR
jgi:hypothetical protein